MFLCPGNSSATLKSPHSASTKAVQQKKNEEKVQANRLGDSLTHLSELWSKQLKGLNLQWITKYTERKSGPLSNNSILRNIPRRTESRDSDTLTPMFIAASFVTAKWQKQPKCSSTDEWVNKMHNTYTYNGIIFGHKKQ